MNRVDTIDESPVPGLDQLQRLREPSRDLWQGIEARLTPRAPVRRRATWPYALAASVCLAVVVAALLRQPASVAPAMVAMLPAADETPAAPQRPQQMPYSNRDHGSRDATGHLPRTLRSESLDDAPVLVAQRAETGGLMKANLSHGSRGHAQEALLRANLKLVRQAEREVRRALREDPESEALQSLLDAAHAKQAQLTAMLVHEQD